MFPLGPVANVSFDCILNDFDFVEELTMRRASNEPSTSTGIRARPTRYSVQQVVDIIQNSDSDEGEFHDDYPSSDDYVEALSESESDDSENERQNVARRSRTRAPQPRDRGDACVIDEGWTRNFVAPTVDLSFNEDGKGPVNIPSHINEESTSIDFLSLFIADDFWQNLTEKTNLRAHQVRAEKPNCYYSKNFKDASVEEMKAFVGLRIYMEYLCIKPSYRDYWSSEGTDFIGFTPGFRNITTRDRFLALWTFLHVVDEQDVNIDKTDRIYKVRSVMDYLLPKFRYYYQSRQHLSLDEGMIPTKNRLAIKQFLKDKPTKWGIKSFLLCEAETGYVLNAEIYTGTAPMPVQSLTL